MPVLSVSRACCIPILATLSGAVTRQLVDDMSKAVDMLMLTVTEGGRERTQDEWTRLFASSGFGIEAQTELPVLISIFTLAPV